jgi:sulfur relay (sulfurtransferase) DsrC/TusE family protein
VLDLFKKGPAPETNKITSVQNEQNMPQEPKTPETADKVDSPQVEELPNVPDVLDLSVSFQKMRTEEQELLETKQALLKTQQDLQSKLVKEIAKKKMAIDELKSEIPDIQNRCRQLGQVLGVDIYS